MSTYTLTPRPRVVDLSFHICSCFCHTCTYTTLCRFWCFEDPFFVWQAWSIWCGGPVWTTLVTFFVVHQITTSTNFERRQKKEIRKKRWADLSWWFEQQKCWLLIRTFSRLLDIRPCFYQRSASARAPLGSLLDFLMIEFMSRNK